MGSEGKNIEPRHYLVTTWEISLTLVIRKQGPGQSLQAGSPGKRQLGKEVKPELELSGYVDFLKELRKVGVAELGFRNNGHPRLAGGNEGGGTLK